MKVFVTGATGAIGSHAVPALIAAGHAVTAVARTPAKAASLNAQRATPVTVSIFDPAALAQAFAGHDAVVNLASGIPPTSQFMRAKAWENNDRVRTEGSAAIVEAAIAAKIGRIVQESISMLYPDRGADWIDEDVPPEPFPRALPNLTAEANARRFAAAGGTAVVLRFGVFYGPGATHSEELLALARRHIGVVMGAGDSYMSSIHVTDAAASVVAALHVAAGTYNIVDDEPLTKRAYADALAAAARTTAWVHLPGRAAIVLGERAASLLRSQRVSNARFRTATAWRPRYPSAREGWRATAAGRSD